MHYKDLIQILEGTELMINPMASFYMPPSDEFEPTQEYCRVYKLESSIYKPNLHVKYFLGGKVSLPPNDLEMAHFNCSKHCVSNFITNGAPTGGRNLSVMMRDEAVIDTLESFFQVFPVQGARDLYEIDFTGVQMYEDDGTCEDPDTLLHLAALYLELKDKLKILNSYASTWEEKKVKENIYLQYETIQEELKSRNIASDGTYRDPSNFKSKKPLVEFKIKGMSKTASLNEIKKRIYDGKKATGPMKFTYDMVMGLESMPEEDRRLEVGKLFNKYNSQQTDIEPLYKNALYQLHLEERFHKPLFGVTQDMAGNEIEVNMNINKVKELS